MSSNFMAAVTICSDFGAQENKVESFEGLPRKMQMLFFKKGSIFHYGYGHMIPSKEKLPCAWGQGEWSRSRSQGLGGVCHSQMLT